MITKSKSLGQLIKDLDEVFSRYVRRKDSIGGACQCFVCGVWIPISTAHAGHYIDRDQMPTRFDEMNVHPVCQQCNCYDDDHRNSYALKMVLNYGLANVERLEKKSKSLQKFMRHELEELIADFKTRIKTLKK